MVPIVGSGVSDNSGTVIKSELEIDDVPVATDTTNNSASFSWDSTTVTSGWHQIRVYVYDDALNEASITRNVNVVSYTCAPPTAGCRNATKELSAGGTASVTVGELENGSTPGDDCTISAIEIRKGGGSYGDTVALTCSELGPTPITLRVTQDDGQTDTCTATVTVDDPGGYCVDAPTIDSLTLSDSILIARDTNEYTITLKVSDSTGVDDVRGARAMVNFQGSNAGQHRGYFTWGKTVAEVMDDLGGGGVVTLQGAATGSDLTCPGGDVVATWSWEGGSAEGWNLNASDYCNDGQGGGDQPHIDTSGGADGTAGHLYAPGKVAPTGCATGETTVADVTLNTANLDNLQARLWVQFHNQEENGFESDDFYRVLVDGVEVLSLYGPRPGWNEVWEQHTTSAFPASAENSSANIEIRGRSSVPEERYGTDELDILYGGGSCGGFWGFYESDFGGTTYVTPVSASTSVAGNQLTINWTFRVKNAWAVSGPQTDNDISGWSRDASDHESGWVNADLDFAVTANCAPPDFNQDCDVDGEDLDTFESCASGPDVPYTGDCNDADIDGDIDVDQDDFAVFQRCYSGEGNPPDPHCAE